MKYKVEYLDSEGIKHDVKLEAVDEEDALSQLEGDIKELIHVGGLSNES